MTNLQNITENNLTPELLIEILLDFEAKNRALEMRVDFFGKTNQSQKDLNKELKRLHKKVDSNEQRIGYSTHFMEGMRLFSGTAPNLNKSLSMEIDNKFIESVADRWLLKACQDEAPVQVLEYLVKVGADPNFLDSEGVSPLWEASRHANLEAMTFLLAAGADPNLGGFEGQSPLHGAVTSDKNTIEAIKLLLQHGANPNLKEIDGLTPEQIAKKEEREEVVAFFQNLKKQS